MQVHGVCVDLRQHECGADVASWTHRTEDVGSIVTLVAGRRRAAAARRPNAGQGALLADACFILPPQLKRLVALVLGDHGGDQVGKVFWCLLGLGSCPGWRGRTDIWRKPSSRSNAPTVRSANTTPNSAACFNGRGLSETCADRPMCGEPSIGRFGPLIDCRATGLFGSVPVAA